MSIALSDKCYPGARCVQCLGQTDRRRGREEHMAKTNKLTERKVM